MYTNEKKGLNVIDILIKVVFAAIFVLLIVWLMPKIPNMKPFYSNVFRENLSYMQEAATTYFTKDKLPTEIGKSTKVSLEDLIDENYIMPFVDEDGNSCNIYRSYAEVTKNEYDYTLKVKLTCNKDSDFIIKNLGCNNYCDQTNVCGETSTIEKTALQYQFKKTVDKTITSYKCKSGYSRSGKYCYKTIKDNYEKAIPVYEEDKTIVEAALVNKGGETKQLLDTIVKQAPNTYKCTTGTLYNTKYCKVQLAVIKKVVEDTTKTETYSCTKYKNVETCNTTYKKENYSCTKYKDVEICNTTYKKEAYKCECVTKFVGGVYTTTCNTCYKTIPVKTCATQSQPYTDTCTRTIPVETCSTQSVPYTGTCSRTVTVPGSTTYSCPSGTDTQTGSGSNLKCYSIKNATVVEGKKTYTCPVETDEHTGSESSLKCYKVIKTSDKYYCLYESAVLRGTKCYRTVKGDFKEWKCTKKDYILDGDTCYKKSTEKIKATVTKSVKKTTLYKWSSEKTLKGWTFTGKTKTVKVK